MERSSITGAPGSPHTKNIYGRRYSIGQSGKLTIAPPWVAIKAIMECRLVALDEATRFCPVVIGKIILRILGKCVLLLAGATSK